MISRTAAAIAASLIFTVSPVLAIDSTPSGKVPAIKQKVEQKVENKETKITQKIDDIKTKIASRTATLKARLTQFKDQKKAEITDRINTNLNSININRTNEMTKNLSKMSVILDKLEARINQGTPDIKNPDAAKAALASARGVIASASAKVQAQSQKDYTVTVTSETKVKTDVQKVRQQLATDLLTARKSVIDAKQSVSNAIRIAKSGQSTEKEGTSSGKQ